MLKQCKGNRVMTACFSKYVSPPPTNVHLKYCNDISIKSFSRRGNDTKSCGVLTQQFAAVKNWFLQAWTQNTWESRNYIPNRHSTPLKLSVMITYNNQLTHACVIQIRQARLRASQLVPYLQFWGSAVADHGRRPQAH